jgi:phage tail-like protein
VARKTIELIFDEPVIIRRSTGPTIASPPESDPRTPVTWTGETWDAANPANYTFSRPSGGNLDGPGEAIDLVATWVEAAEGYGYTATMDPGLNGTVDYEVSLRLWVHTDFQHTPLADYRVLVDEVKADPSYFGIVEGVDDTADFAGWVVSHVVRSSLRLDEILGQEPFREDYSGELANFLIPLQETFDRILEDVDAFFDELSTIDHMRREFLDALLFDLGDPLGSLFPLSSLEKRKLARSLVRLYKEKGTCVGLTNAIQFFVGVTISGCTQAWEDTWQLAGGAYPSPVNGDELGVGSILGPGTLYDVLGFWILHPTPGSLTADEVDKIEAIAEYMKPAHTHYLGIKAP